MLTPHELQEQYNKGVNITQLLRQDQQIDYNTSEIVEIAYDLQTGTYIAALEKAEAADFKKAYTSEIAKKILALCRPESILEAGIGEATTLSGVLEQLAFEVNSYGFDLSWSRVAYAKRWLAKNGFSKTSLCTGNLMDIPFADNSIDVVYTSHSIEPNGGKEKAILQELFRVTRKYLILLEPGFELANDEAQKRMEQHGYCKNLKSTAESLGYDVKEHSLFPIYSNPLNPTAITVIQKQFNPESSEPSFVFACPKFKTPLLEIDTNTLYSPEALAVYPILGGIPCLRIENSIFASKYEEVMSLK